MTFLQINGVDMPTPDSYRVGIADFDSSSTKLTEAAKLKRQRIREGRLKVILTYTGRSIQEFKIISDAIRPANFSATFFNPWAFEMTTCNEMYSSADKEAEAVIIKDTNESKWSTTFSIIEY